MDLPGGTRLIELPTGRSYSVYRDGTTLLKNHRDSDCLYQVTKKQEHSLIPTGLQLRSLVPQKRGYFPDVLPRNKRYSVFQTASAVLSPLAIPRWKETA